ncbi:HTTM domain-containing protein [Neolewinella agarilytica]|uniref:HTTM domain-containing protein n=1 Tax=Neolewinella agarilytica TaxID=478744 RepID=UPI002354DB85|nr:HTTM domain-containing protein [Neolewinella agarilytica]
MNDKLPPGQSGLSSVFLSGNDTVSAAPLATFRIGFGLMMLLSVIRFWWNGWIEKLYLEPEYFFSYRYFEWVKPLGDWTYLLFGIIALSAFLMMIGWRFRLASIAFFLSFTYVELMDKTTYLNHYYFVSILAFTLIWLPAASAYSADTGWQKGQGVPGWTITALKVLVGVVYFYAGLAKLNSDWLLHAQPLAIWLPAKYSIPLLGDLLQQRWVQYAFSWSGAAYDLLIPFLLLWRPTRIFAFILVVVFHLLTRVLFPIGMFPYVMIVSATIFFAPAVHERFLNWVSLTVRSIWPGSRSTTEENISALRQAQQGAQTQVQGKVKKQSALPPYIVATIIVLHLLLPWRYLLHSGELFWTEEGYRFSWRVMLMEKAGYTNFRLVDPDTGKSRVINPGDYLTTFQEKQMSTQPDFILEFAHFLAREKKNASGRQPEVYVESYVALNGRGSQVYVRPDLDLTTITFSTPRTEWLMPFEDSIYGL